MLASTTGLALETDELALLSRMMSSERVLAAFLAIAAAAAMFLVLMLDGAVAEAQSAPTPIQVAAGSVIVWETAIPEDWPQGQPSHIIMTLEAYSADDAPLSFTLDDMPDAAKFSLIPAGMNEAGNYTAHLVLKEGEEIDYETQDTYLIGVEVTTGAGDKTELLIRLRIIDVAEAVPSPEPTPTDPCFETISASVNIVRSWDSSCLSENRPNDAGAGDYYARFYTFALDEPASVSILLTSEVDTYLYLMEGAEQDGVVIEENDDVVQYRNLNSAITDRHLGAGQYTVEATAYEPEMAGDFRLVVVGLPGDEPRADCATGGAVPNPVENAELVADCEVLLSLRDALAGSALLNWDASLPIDGWTGIAVGGATMRVTELSLAESGLNGVIPDELGMLTALRTLSLSDNRLRGLIPDELGALVNLRQLSLDSNELSGVIPDELGMLTALRTLSLSDNRLRGLIPDELGALVNLRQLSLDSNELSGMMPATLGELVRLTTLALNDNMLVGAIPAELTDIYNLEDLKLAGNRLDGCIPPALFDVEENDLALTGLYMCPSGVCTTGSAVENPDEDFGLVWDCDALLAARDQLAGTAELNWSADVPIEDWEGVVVAGSDRRVKYLVLNHRGLNGTLPPGLGRLDRLSLLHLLGNDLYGAIPVDLGALRNLELLILAYNRLSGEIPPELSSLTNLKSLMLDNNRLSGEIPVELGDLSELRSLYLNDNQLTGEIPRELTMLTNLAVLRLSGNSPSGCIPYDLASVEDTDLQLLALPLCSETDSE